MSKEPKPSSSGEMNMRRANWLRSRLLEEAPQLTVEVWHVAQGLARIRVTGPTNRGPVELVLRTELDVATIRAALAAQGPYVPDWATQPVRSEVDA